MSLNSDTEDLLSEIAHVVLIIITIGWACFLGYVCFYLARFIWTVLSR